ncbi:MAG: flagellar motor switch protein FliG, partial [Sphingorhabdus sp.]
MADDTELEDDLEQEEVPEVEAAPTINGGSAAAILLMLLEEADAAAILKHFEPEEVRTLGKSMFDAASVSEAEIELALDRFVLGSRTISTLAVGADARIRNVMNEALGNVRADNILAAIAPQSSAESLEILRWMETPAIARILMSEHPQVGAIILAVLTPAAAASVLEGLDEALQADLVCRAARLSSVQRDAIDDLEAILTAATGTKAQKPGLRLGGKAEVAKIVNKM